MVTVTVEVIVMLSVGATLDRGLIPFLSLSLHGIAMSTATECSVRPSEAVSAG
jgi:hypothetical protein